MLVGETRQNDTPAPTGAHHHSPKGGKASSRVPPAASAIATAAERGTRTGATRTGGRTCSGSAATSAVVMCGGYPFGAAWIGPVHCRRPHAPAATRQERKSGHNREDGNRGAACDRPRPALPGPLPGRWQTAIPRDLRTDRTRTGCPLPPVVYWPRVPPAPTTDAVVGSRRPADPHPLDLAERGDRLATAGQRVGGRSENRTAPRSRTR